MSHKKSRKHIFGRGEGGGVNLGLIITPMLDMSFQLLAFFVMTYNPPVHVGFIEGSLLPPSQVSFAKPKDKKDKQVDPKEPLPPPVDKEPEMADALLVVVRTVKKGQTEGDKGDDPKNEWARRNGDPSYIEIKRPESTTPKVLSGDTALRRDRFIEELRLDLERELKRILNEPGSKVTRASGKAELKLEVDGDLKHRYWMSFYDTCKQAGFQSISFVAPPPASPPAK